MALFHTVDCVFVGGGFSAFALHLSASQRVNGVPGPLESFGENSVFEMHRASQFMPCNSLFVCLISSKYTHTHTNCTLYKVGCCATFLFMQVVRLQREDDTKGSMYLVRPKGCPNLVWILATPTMDNRLSSRLLHTEEKTSTLDCVPHCQNICKVFDSKRIQPSCMRRMHIRVHKKHNGPMILSSSSSFFAW